MKPRTLKKKACVLLLAMAMIITVLPQFSTTVHAAELPDSTKFATVDELKQFNTNDNDNDGKNPAKVYFGNNNQQWWIAGSQNDNGLTLFAASPLKTYQMFESDGMANKQYSDNWGCTYLDGKPSEVYPNHYGASPLRNTLKELETSYFTSTEQKLMNDTTIYTLDMKNTSDYSTTDKLYLAYGDEEDTFLKVGTNERNNLSSGLHIDSNYWAKDNHFWTRAPHRKPAVRDCAMAALKDGRVFQKIVSQEFDLVPAFELDLSSVVFASAAPAASSDGELDVKAVDGDGAFTLRHSGKDVGTAQISFDKSEIALAGVPAGAFLVIQNADGAWAKKITNETSIVPGDVTGFLQNSFENCMVWLETTDDVNRITYAALASCSVNVTGNTGLSITSGNGRQEVALGTEIQPITVTADDGYYFPEDYSVAAQNGISVTRDSYTKLTISGTPTGDVNITLPAAKEKANRTDTPSVTGGIGSTINDTDITMEYAASETSDTWTSCADGSTETGAGTWHVRYKETDTQKASDAVPVEVIAPTYTISVDQNSLDFADQNEGDERVASQSVTIKNEGNSKVTLKTPVSLSYNAALSANEIVPNQTADLTISPKTGLITGDYNETIVIQTEQGTSVNVDVRFKVNGALKVSLSASPETIVEGQSAVLAVSVEGGSKTYTYTWYTNDAEDNSLKGDAVTVAPTVTTTYKVVVKDTIEDKSAAATVTVVPKRYDLEVPGDIAFNRHTGDADTEPKSVRIKNTGNMEAANISAVLSGPDADAFTLDAKGMQTTLSPGGETSFSVTPQARLAPGKYTAEVQITGDAGIRETAGITLTVTDHDYEAVVTDPACTSRGYTTHTCKICGDSFQDGETEILGHDFGEWKVTKEPTTAEKGEKTRRCSRCNTEEKLSIPALDKKPEKDEPEKEKPEKDKPDQENAGVETGDRTNTLLWGFLFIVSSIVFLSSLYCKKQKLNQ